MFIKVINWFFKPLGYEWVMVPVEKAQSRSAKASTDEDDWNELKAQSGAYKLQMIKR